MSNLPSFREDHISQIPALQLLMKLGYQYLSPDEFMTLRGGRSSNVLLEPILKAQLERINGIEYKGKTFAFSESNIQLAISTLRDLPLQEGFMKANQAFYDLITLGKSFEQSVLNDRFGGAKKSFSFRYIDWKNPENNVFHVSEEFSVLRSDSNHSYRPDIVLFVNGIPMVVIECKSNVIKDPITEVISQQLRNQQDDGIRSLYLYSNLVLALAVNEARYATTATSKEFWGVWKEVFRTKEAEATYTDTLNTLKNNPLLTNERTAIFEQRFASVKTYFNRLEQAEQLVTEQDRLLFSLCQKERLLDLIFNFTLYDEGTKKICRYQQFFAIKETLKRILDVGHWTLDSEGTGRQTKITNHQFPIPNSQKRLGGVIWHTQGSGKSLTMVMLAQLIASKVPNPKIILVTDRIDLNTQITETFQKCHVDVFEAQTGKELVALVQSPSNAVITTLIHKFEAAIKQAEVFDSPDIFVLIDEGHRSQYGTLGIKMQKVFPNACFIAFTGTPLMKKEKSTANKFGGIIDVYAINDAVADKAVVPLLYEGRHNIIEVNAKPLDNYFDRVAEPLTPYGKAALKKKYATQNQLNQADQVIYARAWDISEHFVANFQHTTLGNLKAKGQLVTPNKTTAIKYREYFREIGKVSCEVLISPPDVRENYEDAFEENENLVQKFWKAMMNKYNKVETYEKSIIAGFKKQEQPEIIIVVDKLLTGFDAPNNQVLYITRSLKEHTLLQAIARVNRVAEGKDYGYIIDYYGNLENLDQALNTYSGLQDFEQDELAGTLISLNKEIEKLPQAHDELWGIFKKNTKLKNQYDAEAYAHLLNDESLRYEFYEKLSAFIRLFKTAMSSATFNDEANSQLIDKYKTDSKFFLELRANVKRRYFDEADYTAYESQVQKLIDKHITADVETLKITDLVNIFDKEARETEVEKLTTKAAKADHIASRTLKAINVKMSDDKIFYTKLSTLIRQLIEDYHQHRITEAEYLQKARDLEQTFLSGKQANVPATIQDNAVAIAYYNQINTLFEQEFTEIAQANDQQAELALEIEHCIKATIYDNHRPIVDWQTNTEIEKRITNGLDDLLYEIKLKHKIEIPFDKIDELIEEVLKIAKLKYTA